MTRYCPREQPDTSVTFGTRDRPGEHMRTRGVALLVLGVLAIASCGNASNNSDDKNTPGSTQKPGATTTTADLSIHHAIKETGVTDKEIRVSVVAAVSN